MPVVLVEKKQDVCIVTLNRPERMNAINAELREALIAALSEANQDASVRALVITGAGDQAFSSG
ncbi:MAG TPA: enoyl-CoA hydratase/isomerase family protein, partial [Hyphomicrobiaceae bacterium]|nr:enoyl-CoA hydratase/isomerase family protein [Hyphomicrobiaceae bacterium]